MISMWIINTLFGGSAISYFNMLLVINLLFTAFVVWKPSILRNKISQYATQYNDALGVDILPTLRYIALFNTLGMIVSLNLYGWDGGVSWLIGYTLIAIVAIQSVYVFKIVKSLEVS